MRFRMWACAGVAIAACVLGGAPHAWAGVLSPEESRGKRIYLEGRSETGRMITARVGRSSTPMPGKTFPCVGCHGSDGVGLPEGGVVPAEITWSRLTTPVFQTGGTDRARSAYTESLISRAITGGLNADGVMLEPTMPRFEMDKDDLRDLVSYLRRIEADLDPGLTERTIALGTIVPKGETPAALGSVVASVLKGYVQDINEQGGIYNRQLELTVKEAATRDQAVEHAAALTAQESLFAVVSPVTAGIEQDVERLADAHQIPLIGPVTEFPRSDEQMQRHAFYVLGGLTTEAKVLLSFAEMSLGPEPVQLAVVYPRQEAIQPVVAAIQQQAQSRRWSEPVMLAYAAGSLQAVEAAAQLDAAHINLLLFLGSAEEAVALAQEGARVSWNPRILMLSRSAGPALFEMPKEFEGRVHLAFSNAPVGAASDKGAEFEAFRSRHRLPPHHMAAQASAYAAATVLVEGLKRAGSRLSRERLINALEQFYEFQTGVTPPLSYNPNRRVGSQVAQIVALDAVHRRLSPVASWMGSR